MRIVTIDLPNDQDAWIFDCLAHIGGQTYRMLSGEGRTDPPLNERKLLVRALRDFADYIDRSAEWPDPVDPRGDMLAAYREGRLKGGGL